MHNSAHNIKQVTGLSLIEMMVALAVSAILLLGVATVYTASKRSYQVNNEIAELQENARFALHTMTKEIRMAGYTGCGNVNSINLNIISTTIPEGFAPPNPPAPPAIVQGNFGQNNYVTGHTIDDGGTATPAFDDPRLLPDNIVANTDAITILKADACSASVQANNGANLQILSNCGFEQGDVVIVTNCRTADMFTNTNVPDNNGNGNITLTFANNANRQNRLTNNYTQQNKSRVLKANTIVYYIGTDENNTPGLHERRLTNQGGVYQAVSRLLVPNVERMVINYGVDTIADLPVSGTQTNSVDVIDRANVVDGLAIPAAISVPGDTPWSRVTRIDLRLLFRSDNVGTSPKPYTFNNINFDGADQPLPNDNRYRREFISAINIRNRTP